MATRRRASRSNITGSVSDVQRRIRYLEGRPAPSRLATSVVQRVNIEARSVSTDQIALAAVTNDQLAADAITAAKIGANSVGLDEVAANAVGTSEMQLDSVGTDELGIDAVINENVGTDAINNGNMSNGSVNSAEMTNDSVGGSELAVGAVYGDNIPVDGVGSSELDTNSVQSSEISTDAIGTSELGVDAANASNLGMDSVGNSELASYAVGSANLGTDSVDADALAPGAVGSASFSGGAVGSSELDPGCLTNNKIQDYSISYNKVENNYAILSMQNNAALGQGVKLMAGSTGRNASIQAEFGQQFWPWEHDTVSEGNHTHSVSTKRIKKDISHHDIENIEKYLNLDLKQFKYVEDLKPLMRDRDFIYGYIAEEASEQGIEELLSFDENMEPNGFEYDYLSTMVVEILKIQRAEIESLEEEIQRLKDSQ